MLTTCAMLCKNCTVHNFLSSSVLLLLQNQATVQKRLLHWERNDSSRVWV